MIHLTGDIALGQILVALAILGVGFVLRHYFEVLADAQQTSSALMDKFIAALLDLASVGRALLALNTQLAGVQRPAVKAEHEKEGHP